MSRTLQIKDHLRPAGIAAAAVIAAGFAEFAVGREPVCTCGSIKLWHGVVLSAENSQHLADWYTPSHVVHGLAFFGLTWLVLRRMSLAWRFAIAVVAEAA